MYVTAHRVTRRDTGETGVNAFLHLHGAQDPKIKSTWTHADVDRVAYENPGTICRQLVELAPGGNAVMSYLDVVAADSTKPDQIVEAVRQFGGKIESEEIPITLVVDQIAVRLSLVQGLSGQEHLEFERLAKALAAIVSV